VIDLHLHTTASDGALDPPDLVARARAAGITTLGVADHDTTAALPAARAAAAAAGAGFVDGIEITAVDHERDVHVLGYFLDPASSSLQAFLERQRNDRVRRVSEIVRRLAALGVEIDPGPILAKAAGGRRSIGRPHVADALIAAGHVASRDEAFERYLGSGKPAFVPRRGAAPAAVVGVIHDAGGVAVLAHPGLSAIDPAIPALAAQGLDGIEVRHPEHDGVAEARYRALAAELGLATTAGSDFHADGGRHPSALGAFTMTSTELAALEARRR
jgi:hypothetical protein